MHLHPVFLCGQIFLSSQWWLKTLKEFPLNLTLLYNAYGSSASISSIDIGFYICKEFTTWSCLRRAISYLSYSFSSLYSSTVLSRYSMQLWSLIQLLLIYCLHLLQISLIAKHSFCQWFSRSFFLRPFTPQVSTGQLKLSSEHLLLCNKH